MRTAPINDALPLATAGMDRDARLLRIDEGTRQILQLLIAKQLGRERGIRLGQ